jgi:hypothetical protein
MKEGRETFEVMVKDGYFTVPSSVSRNWEEHLETVERNRTERHYEVDQWVDSAQPALIDDGYQYRDRNVNWKAGKYTFNWDTFYREDGTDTDTDSVFRRCWAETLTGHISFALFGTVEYGNGAKRGSRYDEPLSGTPEMLLRGITESFDDADSNVQFNFTLPKDIVVDVLRRFLCNDDFHSYMESEYGWHSKCYHSRKVYRSVYHAFKSGRGMKDPYTGKWIDRETVETVANNNFLAVLNYAMYVLPYKWGSVSDDNNWIDGDGVAVFYEDMSTAILVYPFDDLYFNFEEGDFSNEECA